MRIPYYLPPIMTFFLGPRWFRITTWGGKFASTWELHRAMENLLEVGDELAMEGFVSLGKWSK